VGILFAVGALTCKALVITSLRFLRDLHYSISSTLYGTLGVIFTATLAITHDPYAFSESRTTEVWSLLCLESLFLFVGMYALTVALQFEKAGVVSLIRCFDVVFSFLLGMTINEMPTVYRYC